MESERVASGATRNHREQVHDSSALNQKRLVDCAESNFAAEAAVIVKSHRFETSFHVT